MISAVETTSGLGNLSNEGDLLRWLERQLQKPGLVPKRALIGFTPEDWHEVGAAGEPAFENGWTNHSASRKAAFYKDPFGTVHLAGLVSSGTVPATAFTLPEGYWIVTGGANAPFSVVSNSAFGRVDVSPTGEVNCMVGNNAYFSLYGITFRAGV